MNNVSLCMQEALEASNRALQEKQAQLKEIHDKVKSLQQQLQATRTELSSLQQQVSPSRSYLQRAGCILSKGHGNFSAV